MENKIEEDSKLDDDGADDDNTDNAGLSEGEETVEVPLPQPSMQIVTTT